MIGGPVAYFTVPLFSGDHDTIQPALAPLVEDTPLREPGPSPLARSR